MYAWSVSCLRRCLRKDSALQLHSPRWIGSLLARPKLGHLWAVQRPLLPARLPRGAQWAVQRPLLPARLPRRAQWAAQRLLLPARLPRGAQWMRLLRLPWLFLQRCPNERLGQKSAGKSSGTEPPFLLRSIHGRLAAFRNSRPPRVSLFCRTNCTGVAVRSSPPGKTAPSAERRGGPGSPPAPPAAPGWLNRTAGGHTHDRLD